MIKDKNQHHDSLISQQLAALSTQDFLNLGNDGLSYIRSISHEDGHIAYALFGADGSHISSKQDIETLHVIARQNNLIPMSVQ
jgi:hypothetical protein